MGRSRRSRICRRSTPSPSAPRWRTWRHASGAPRPVSPTPISRWAQVRVPCRRISARSSIPTSRTATSPPARCTGAGRVETRTHASCTSTSRQSIASTTSRITARSRARSGQALGDHDITPRVIGNADLGLETPAQLRYRRPAGATVMNGAGADPTRRGVRGDVSCARMRRRRSASCSTKRRCCGSSTTRGPATAPRVVLVEASDLSRAEEYAPSATPAEAERHRRDALERSDALVGALLEHVDPERDSVMLDRARRPVRRRRPLGGRVHRTRTRTGTARLGHDPTNGLRATLRRRTDRARSVRSRRADRDGRPAVPAHGERRVVRRSRQLPRRQRARSRVAGPGDPVRDHDPDARRHRARVRVSPARARLPDRLRRALPTIAIAVLALVPATYASALASVQNGVALVISMLVPAILLTIGLEVLRRRHPFQAVAAALVDHLRLVRDRPAVGCPSAAEHAVRLLDGGRGSVRGRRQPRVRLPRRGHAAPRDHRVRGHPGPARAVRRDRRSSSPASCSTACRCSAATSVGYWRWCPRSG